ncbi:hypothetical protein QQX98_009511 [Neonectria punicea]|uniref:Cytochrome P450 n=1 Tax=Neonectria punicea TaxID=979145 RepID=A0ABR1GSJ4_9HYPO
MLNDARKRFPLINLALLLLIPLDAASNWRKHQQLPSGKVMKRMALGTDLKRDDSFSYLLKKGIISEQELKSQANTLIIAGSETTFTVLTGLMCCHLLQNKPSLGKLTEEVRSAF